MAPSSSTVAADGETDQVEVRVMTAPQRHGYEEEMFSLTNKAESGAGEVKAVGDLEAAAEYATGQGGQNTTSSTNTSAVDLEERVSAIRYVNNGDSQEQQQQREGHLMVLLPLSHPTRAATAVAEDNSTNYREVSDFRVYNEVSAFLAHRHIQRRSGAVLPDLPRRLATCDISWTYRHYDTQFSSLQAAKHLFEVASSRNSELLKLEQQEEELFHANKTVAPLEGEQEGRTLDILKAHSIIADNQHHEQQQQQPFAILGAAISTVSETVATLAVAYDLPQISPGSTAASLDNMPLFARTIPTNAGDAHAIMAYLRHLLLDKDGGNDSLHIGVLYINNTWGRFYKKELQNYAPQYGVTIFAVPFQADDMDDLEGVMQQLKQSHLRYFVGVLQTDSWKPLIRAAFQNGIIGNDDYQWFFGEWLEQVGDDFALDPVREWDLAQALHGVGTLLLKASPHEAFDRAMDTFANSRQMQQDFIESHSEPYLFDDFEWKTNPSRSLLQYTTYDAVVALGLTACDTPGLFTGTEFYNNLRKVDFEGVSGRVQLDEKTGTRKAMLYEMVNLIVNDYGNATVTAVTFDARPSVTIDLSPVFEENDSRDQDAPPPLPFIQTNDLFVYHDNTTIPPRVLPPLEGDMNLIPPSARYFGLSLAALVMLASIGCALWTGVYRKEYVVRAAQPVFLIQICVGTFILSSTIVLLSFQEAMPGLDAACATMPWTLCVGFVLAISALFSKAERINQLMNSGKKIRRIRVDVCDVLKTFLIILHVNFGFLLGWTFSPYKLTWRRMPVENFDDLGRSVESFGACRPNGGWWFLIFVIPLFVTNTIVLVRCTQASYQGRDLPSEFSESGYLSLAMISLSETILIAVVTLFAVMDDPTSFFLVSSLAMCIGCMSVLVPVFLPKYLQRHTKEPTRRQAQNMLAKKNNTRGLHSFGPSSKDVENMSATSNATSGHNSMFASHPTPIRRTVSASNAKSSKAPAMRTCSDSNSKYQQGGCEQPPGVVSKAILEEDCPVAEGVSTTKNAFLSEISLVKRLAPTRFMKACDAPEEVSASDWLHLDTLAKRNERETQKE